MGQVGSIGAAANITPVAATPVAQNNTTHSVQAHAKHNHFDMSLKMFEELLALLLASQTGHSHTHSHAHAAGKYQVAQSLSSPPS